MEPFFGRFYCHRAWKNDPSGMIPNCGCVTNIQVVYVKMYNIHTH